jgi:hypothetical protein
MIALLLGVVLAAATPAPLASPVPSPSAAASATPAPVPLPSLPPNVPTSPPVPLPSPTSTPTPTPSATPTGLNLPPLTYRVVPKQTASPAPGAPQILEMDFNGETITSTIAMRVLTNDAVTKVIANSGGHSGALTMVAPGRFEALQGKLPRLGVLSVKVSVTFTAYSADGRTATAVVTLKKK